jgi:hypothetical protein
MALSSEDRAVLEKAFKDSMPAIQEIIRVYCEGIKQPVRLALSLYDASNPGPDFEKDAPLASRLIANHENRTADWGERDYTATASRKVRACLRTGRDTGDLVLHAPELFEEGDQKSPGGCLAEVDGKPVCIAGSGQRGLEDAAFALLTIEFMKRLLAPPA